MDKSRPKVNDGPAIANHVNGEISAAEKPAVLFVDDEANILASMQRLLRKEDFRFRSTTSPSEALKLIQEETFAVIVSDHRMPEMEGTLLLEQVKKTSPETIRILLTGYADLNATIDAINKGSIYRFISKPWNDAELCTVLRQGVAQYGLLKENRRLQELTARQNLELIDLNSDLEKRVELRTEEITRLNRDLEKSFLASIRALAGFTEMNSPQIGSHSRRVAAKCKAIGRLLGLSVDDSFQLEVASLLHDIGEITIPMDLLRKPEASLRPPELQLLQRHVLLGEGVMRLIPKFEKAALMVRHHHERFNGTGYPNRLKGEAIPIGARIIAVADAYDIGLNNRRSFQNTTPEMVLAKLEKRSEWEFDPKILEALKCSLAEETLDSEKDEVEVALSDLAEGMVLSRDMRSQLGALLLPRNTVLAHEHLAKISTFEMTEQLNVHMIFIKRKQPVEMKKGANA